MRPKLDTTWAAALAILAMMVGAAAASAQPAPAPTVPDQLAPPRSDAPSNDPTPLKPPRNPADQSLSDQLDRQDGVISPPNNVDHGIVKPPPANGAMPVIPPPGSPGSTAPNVQPK